LHIDHPRTSGRRAPTRRSSDSPRTPNVTSIIRTQLTRASLSVSRREMIHLECLEARRGSAPIGRGRVDQLGGKPWNRATASNSMCAQASAS
jgi:hypothetical protein